MGGDDEGGEGRCVSRLGVDAELTGVGERQVLQIVDEALQQEGLFEQ